MVRQVPDIKLQNGANVLPQNSRAFSITLFFDFPLDWTNTPLVFAIPYLGLLAAIDYVLC